MRTSFLSAAMFAAATGALAAPGDLVIVGGALESDNAAIFETFIQAMPDSEAGTIAVIPVSSGVPAQSFQAFRDDLARYGVPENRVSLVRLAVVDDPETDDVDESGWAENGESEEEAAKVRAADAIWFTGGDQRRIGGPLIDEEGNDSVVMRAVRERHAQGAAVGGTSAGAALMSRLMITGGDNHVALVETPDSRAEGRLELGLGTGLMPVGVVDQHFDERARLGRLTRAVSMLPSGPRIGIGVDENTAAVVDFDAGAMTALGAGGVTLVDGRDAVFSQDAPRLRADDIRLSVLTGGDRWNIQTGDITPAGYKARTRGDEYYSTPDRAGGGMGVPGGTLLDVVGRSLVDNSASARADRYSFLSDGRGFRYRFEKDGRTAGFWGRDEDGQSRYTVVDVRFSITPVDVAFTPVEEAAE